MEVVCEYQCYCTDDDWNISLGILRIKTGRYRGSYNNDILAGIVLDVVYNRHLRFCMKNAAVPYGHLIFSNIPFQCHGFT